MSTNNVNVGKGCATGMFYYADENTTLPSSFSSLTDWTEAGFISEDGMEIALDKSKENIKDWSGTVRRVVLTEHEEKASGVAITTTTTTLSELFGSANVTSSNGTITVNLSASDLPPAKAYLFIMKDGDDIIAFGCESGQISVADSITFKAGEVISWPFEIVAQGDGMQLIKVEGATGSTGENL